MTRKIAGIAVLAVLIVSSVLGAFLISQPSSPSRPSSLLDQGIAQYQNNNFVTAASTFNQSYAGFMAVGNVGKAMEALDWRQRADLVLYDYSLERAGAELQLRELFPFLSNATIQKMLDDPTSEKLLIDGTERFYYQIGMNMAYRNLTLHSMMIQPGQADVLGEVMMGVMAADEGVNVTSSCFLYFNEANYTAYGTLTLERSALPSSGTLRVWVPGPVNVVGQVIKHCTVTPSDRVKTNLSISADLGQIYLEITLDGLTGDIVVSVEYSFTTLQRHFSIDPSTIGLYDRGSADYVKYTSSEPGILIAPNITKEAKQVVGNVSNPYVQAKLLYDFVIGNITYSLVPAEALSAMGISQSEYVYDHRYGDCGAQSMYYCALLRSLGIPARSCGGYQMFGDGTGTHIWAEFMLPNGMWVPVDVTMSEGMDWCWSLTAEQRASCKAFFFGNLDNMRYTIQNDLGVALEPRPVTSMLSNDSFQFPAADCAGSDQDLMIMAASNWDFSITKA